VWAVGTSSGFAGFPTILHFDGTAWSASPLPFLPTDDVLHAVWASTPTDAWIATEGFDYQGFLHWNGSAWTLVPYPTTGGPCYAMWGASASSVYAACSSSIMRWNGTTWSSSAPAGYLTGRAVSGTSDTNVWLGGDGGSLWHLGASGWTSVATHVSTGNIYAIYSSGPTDVWLGTDYGVFHGDGTTFTAVAGASNLRGVAGSSANDVWMFADAFGTSGTPTLHWDGTSTTLVETGNGSPGVMFARASTDAWAVSKSALLHWGGSAWSEYGAGYRTSWSHVHARTATDVWVAGASGMIARYDGTKWSRTPSGTTSAMNGIWASGASDAWAVGAGGTILHFDGTSWSAVPSGTTTDLWAVGGSDATHVWAVGTNVFQKWTGSAWVAETGIPAGGWWRVVWSAGASDVWAFADGGANPIHWDGTSWTTKGAGTPIATNGAWGTSPTDIWTVGDYGYGAHWDGATWNRYMIFTLPLHGVFAAAPNDVWASSDRGILFHYDGTSWAQKASGSFSLLSSMGGTASGDVWAVGADGAILHR